MEPDRQQAIQLIEQADLAVVDGRTDEAREMLEQALEVDPLNVEAKRMLAGIAVREARARGEDTSDLPEQRELAGIEAEDLKIVARRERAMGHDDMADSLSRRALDMDIVHSGHSTQTLVEDPEDIPSVTPGSAAMPANDGPSPAGAVVRFLVGAGVGYVLLYGAHYTSYLPALHDMLHLTRPVDIAACAVLGILAAALFGRKREEQR